MFPISRDPPEGGTLPASLSLSQSKKGFQFLAIPPKGELEGGDVPEGAVITWFPISRDPPEGGTRCRRLIRKEPLLFPISRDPPEGGTLNQAACSPIGLREFPISRDPPEGGTRHPDPMIEYLIRFPISRDPPEGGT